MPILFIIVPTFGNPKTLFNDLTEKAVIEDLNAHSFGAWMGSGGTEGFSCFGYRVLNELKGREMVSKAMEKHLPGTQYFIRVSENSGCNMALEVLNEFLAKKLSINKLDGQTLGPFEQLMFAINKRFPKVQFNWSGNGNEKIKNCQKVLGPLPDELTKIFEDYRSELKGVAEGKGYRIIFSLGYQEPVGKILVTLLGWTKELEIGLSGLETDLGAKFQENS